MSTLGETKELRVRGNDNTKRTMYLIKEFLLNNDSVNVVGGVAGSPIVTKATEALVRLKYVTYGDIKTETHIIEGRRITRIVVTLKKTNDFQRLYEENEQARKKFQAEKQQ